MVAATGLEYCYPQSRPIKLPDINCRPGEVVVVTGASGTGKTTLLHLLGGLLKPSGGRVKINDTDIATMRSGKLDAFRARNIGIVFQRAHFVSSLTVFDNLLLASWFLGRKKTNEKAHELLKRLRVMEVAGKLPGKISAGQQQRVSIARALMNDPELLLADEPTSSLDDDNCMRVARLLEDQAKIANLALVIVTHDQRLKSVFNNVVHIS